MADAREFLFNSDFPTPAFVASWQGSFNMSAFESSSRSFNHNLPFNPLIVGQWSTNSNFSPAYDIATTNGYFVGVSLNQATGSTSTKIITSFNNGETAKTFYYRLFAFAPSDYDGEIPSIEDSTNYRFNSDFNYPKLFSYGHRNITSTSDVVVNHNLGYTPQVRVWVYDALNNFTSPVANNYNADGQFNYYIAIDNSKLTLKGMAAQDTVYWHIYADKV